MGRGCPYEIAAENPRVIRSQSHRKVFDISTSCPRKSGPPSGSSLRTTWSQDFDSGPEAG